VEKQKGKLGHGLFTGREDRRKKLVKFMALESEGETNVQPTMWGCKEGGGQKASGAGCIEEGQKVEREPMGGGR